MARGFQLQDLLGYGNATGNPDPIWGSLSGQNAVKDATQAQQDALKKAFDAITGYADKSVALQQPYLQHAGQDYNQLRGLVQGGYYSTPYGKSFQGATNTPQGFSFNPSQGGASFAPRMGQPSSFTPQGLPSKAGYAPPATGLMGGSPAQPPAAPLNPINSAQQAYQIQMRQNPAPGMSATPMANNIPAVTANPLAAYNPQTGQGNPLVSMGFKPADPRIPDPKTLALLKLRYPWLTGGSGPLEGGMPGRGMF